MDPYIATGVNPAAIYAAAYAAMNPAPAAPAVREPTPLERADALLMYGEPKAAAEAYRKYLEDAPGDAAPMRSLAVALLQQRRFDEAVAVMAMAYEREPRLARTAIDPLFFEDSANLRKSVNAMVTYANRVNSASSWMTVATLMQAEERDDVALRMIERAKDLGLSATVVDQFTDVLKKSN